MLVWRKARHRRAAHDVDSHAGRRPPEQPRRSPGSCRATHEFPEALARAGLPKQRFHDTRHAAATLLLEAGEDIGVVSRLLGHSTVSLTLDIYGHLTDRMSERASARLDAVLEADA